MKHYSINLKYVNNYHSYQFDMAGYIYIPSDGEGYKLAEYIECEPDDDFILYLEKYFTEYLRRITYNDIVFADEYELKLGCVDLDSGYIVHVIDWFKPRIEKYIHIMSVVDNNITTEYLSFEDGINRLKELDIVLPGNNRA